eukprot:scaffold22641_cov206-Cylindrotheca_fusiformis.AAC.3
MTTERQHEVPAPPDVSCVEEELLAMKTALEQKDEEITKLKSELAKAKSQVWKKRSSPRGRGKRASVDGHVRRRGSLRDSLRALDLRVASESQATTKSPKREVTKKHSLSSLITRPAGKAVRGSVAVLDKTVDMGWKAGKAVVKGSVVVFDKTIDTGKKAGRIFGFKSERRKRLSQVSEKKSTFTQWDNAVEIIDELLDDGVVGLTPQQRSGLRAAQELLLGGVANQVEKTFHIPINLLDNTNKRGGRVSMASKSYVLEEYGGITPRRERPTLTRQEGIRPSTGVKHFLSEDEWDDTIPSEFLDLSKEKQCQVFKLLTWEKLKAWDYDIFELNTATDGHPLVLMGWAVLGSPYSQRAMAKASGMLDSCDEKDFSEGYNFMESEIKLPLDKLSQYFRLIEDNYRSENPYHNAIHAADVTQTLNALIQMAGDELRTSDEELFSILLAAVVHDVDHPGLNNSYQTTARTNLSLQYNDLSVLENHHASTAFTMMIRSSPFGDVGPPGLLRGEAINLNAESDYNILCNTNAQLFTSIKSKAIDAVLHTDMKLHFQTVSKIKGLIISEETKDDKEAKDDSSTPWEILTFMLHMADISNAAKPGVTARKWTDRCLDEFFNQGDKEKELGCEPSPQCDRDTVSKPDSQIGFIRFVVLPSFEVLACIIPEVKIQVLPHLEQNRQFWESEAMMADGYEEGESMASPDPEFSMTESSDDYSFEEHLSQDTKGVDTV